MRYSVLFRYDAERDTERAQDWYALHAPEQVERFIDDLGNTVTTIAQTPHRFRVLRRNSRRAALRIFPFLIWYRIHEHRRVIEVLAIVHQRQDDEAFSDRID